MSTSSQVEVETSRIIKKITQEKVNQETEYIKIHQNQYTDKVVDVSVEVQKQFPQRQTKAQKELEKETG